MGLFQWFSDSWFILLQSCGIIGGLTFTVVTLRDDIKARRVSNLIAITQHHREIWAQLYARPELSRVLDAAVDLDSHPITEEEKLFVGLLILHLNSSYQAMKSGTLIKPEGVRRDMQLFFALPIPHAIWVEVRLMQDEGFVEFVETALSEL